MKTQGENTTLIDALGIIHGTADQKVTNALNNYNTKNINGDEIEIIDGWIKIMEGDKSKKVARCLVWYIAKIGLDIHEFQTAEFPFKNRQYEYRYHDKRYIK